MMKVHFSETADQVILQVCGRLADAWVHELEKCWNGARVSHPGRPVSVDLRGVTFIDQAGIRLLRSMHGAGVSFVCAGLRNQEVVNQITGGAQS